MEGRVKRGKNVSKKRETIRDYKYTSMDKSVFQSIGDHSCESDPLDSFVF